MLEQESLEELAHELYTAAQLAPGEGIEDAVGRLVALMDTQQPSPTPQADSVLEDAERLKEAAGLLEELAEHGSYSIEYDGRMIPICPECGSRKGITGPTAPSPAPRHFSQPEREDQP